MSASHDLSQTKMLYAKKNQNVWSYRCFYPKLLQPRRSERGNLFFQVIRRKQPITALLLLSSFLSLPKINPEPSRSRLQKTSIVAELASKTVSAPVISSDTLPIIQVFSSSKPQSSKDMNFASILTVPWPNGVIIIENFVEASRSRLRRPEVTWSGKGKVFKESILLKKK